MKKFTFAALIFLFCFTATAYAEGDSVELKDGTFIEGDVIARNDYQVYLSVKRGPVRMVERDPFRSQS